MKDLISIMKVVYSDFIVLVNFDFLVFKFAFFTACFGNFLALIGQRLAYVVLNVALASFAFCTINAAIALFLLIRDVRRGKYDTTKRC